MPKQRILIADDETDGRNLLSEYINEIEDWEIVCTCTNGIEALEGIEKLEPDIAFLDIQMPGLSGLQVVKKLVHLPRIVFSTAYDAYALKAFDHNAIDYLLKPYTRERFKQAVHKLMMAEGPKAAQLKQFAELQGSANIYPEQLLVEQGSKLVRIALQDIIWIEARGDYSAIHTQKHLYMSNNGISTMQMKLPPTSFLRIHRSEIINLGHIKEVYKEPGGLQVMLSNGTMHKVSRSHTDALKQYML